MNCCIDYLFIGSAEVTFIVWARISGMVSRLVGLIEILHRFKWCEWDVRDQPEVLFLDRS